MHDRLCMLVSGQYSVYFTEKLSNCDYFFSKDKFLQVRSETLEKHMKALVESLEDSVHRRETLVDKAETAWRR